MKHNDLKMHTTMQNLRTLLPRIQDDLATCSYKRRKRIFERLSLNPNLPVQFVQDNFHEPWDWSNLSANPAMGPATIEKFPLWLWDFKSLSHNDGLDAKFYLDNMDEDWDFDALSIQDNVPMSFIWHHQDKPWDFHMLSHHPKMDYYFVRDHIDEDWDWPYFIELCPEIGVLGFRVMDRVREQIQEQGDEFLFDADELGPDVYFEPLEVVEEASIPTVPTTR